MAQKKSAPWTPADDAALLAAVVDFWRSAPPRAFQLSWASIGAMLPGRSGIACEQRARALRRSGPRQAAKEGAHEGAGGAGSSWSAHEDATLLAALTLRRSAQEVLLDWHFVSQCLYDRGAPRSANSIQQRWYNISRTPAALAAAAQLDAEAAQGRPASAAAPLAPARRPASAAAILAPASSPFHMLHGLRSAGAIDELTLRACWQAAAEAVR
jgi:hypothetical protein